MKYNAQFVCAQQTVLRPKAAQEKELWDKNMIFNYEALSETRIVFVLLCAKENRIFIIEKQNLAIKEWFL